MKSQAVVYYVRHAESALCAHAGLLRAGFTTLIPKAFKRRLDIPNCCVSRLEIEPSGGYDFAYVVRSGFPSEEISASKYRQISDPSKLTFNGWF